MSLAKLVWRVESCPYALEGVLRYHGALGAILAVIRKVVVCLFPSSKAIAEQGKRHRCVRLPLVMMVARVDVSDDADALIDKRGKTDAAEDKVQRFRHFCWWIFC